MDNNVFNFNVESIIQGICEKKVSGLARDFLKKHSKFSLFGY